jgi:hypothetical protein
MERIDRLRGSAFRVFNDRKPAMTDDPEIEWHREQIVKNQAALAELEASNTSGGDVFPETHSEVDLSKLRSLNLN